MTGNLHNVPDDKLALEVTALDAVIAAATEERKTLLAVIARRYETGIKSAYERAGKQHGKLSVGAVGFSLEVDTRQTVKWDQAKLRAAAETMKPDEAQHYIDIELSVSEKNYNALPPGDVKKALTDARTTKLSAPSIKVVFPTGEK